MKAHKSPIFPKVKPKSLKRSNSLDNNINIDLRFPEIIRIGEEDIENFK